MANIIGASVKTMLVNSTLADAVFNLDNGMNHTGVFGWFTSEPWANIDLAVSGLGPEIASNQIDSSVFTYTYHGSITAVSNGIDIALAALSVGSNRAFTATPTAFIVSDTVSSSYHHIDSNTILAIPISALTGTGQATAGSYFIADPITIQLR
jgi:hypothetical protein